MNNKLLYIIAISGGIILFFIFSYDKFNKTSNENTIGISSYDSQMNNAILEARNKLPEFINHLNNPNKHQIFLIKVRFVDDDKFEHMWVKNIKYDGKYFYGKLNNNPASIRNYYFGQSVKFTKDDVSDWVILSNNNTIGYFTKKVIENKSIGN